MVQLNRHRRPVPHAPLREGVRQQQQQQRLAGETRHQLHLQLHVAVPGGAACHWQHFLVRWGVRL